MSDRLRICIWSILAGVVLSLLLFFFLPSSTLAGYPEPAEGEEAAYLYGTEPLPWASPWEMVLYPVTGILGGCMAVHFVVLYTIPDKLVGGGLDGRVDDD